MINFLIFKRYNMLDLIGQAFAIWGYIKYDNWEWWLIIIPFTFLSKLFESIERVNKITK